MRKVEELKDLAYRAYYNVSFWPEKRAKYIVESHTAQLKEDLETVAEHGGNVERYNDKYISMLEDWLHAKSRCLSSAITGPANFPVRRAEKANNAEHNKNVAFLNWRDKALKAITKPENTDIVRGTDGAIEKLENKLAELERGQETMKGINKILRNKKLSKEEKIDEIIKAFPFMDDEKIEKLMIPDELHGVGFATYALTNNNANINKLRKDIAHEKKRMAKYEEGNKEYEINGVKVVENAEVNRLQLIFDGKPSDDMRSALKQNGFRWSPKNMAWQRQLTENAIYALKRVL